MRLDDALFVSVLPAILVCALPVNCTSVKPQCENCAAEHVKTINASTRRCVGCWPCPVCNEGSGSSVPCGAVMTVGTKLHCVLCVLGTNFSDSTGTGQCQPCGMCSGKHESVHSKCTRENNVVCKCDVGFFRNKTTQECLPCASCCSGDHNILEHCKRGGKAIKKKCKFEEPRSSACLPSLTAVDTISISLLHRYPSILATSSSLISFSYQHSTATPVLGTISRIIAPAPSETVRIKVTSASFPRPDRHSKISEISTVNKANARGETPNRNIVITLSKTVVVVISVAFVLVAVGCVGCIVCVCKYRSWRARNNPGALQMAFESEAGESEERKSSEYSGAAQPLILLTELSPEATTSLSPRTDEGICLLPDIPTSLENEPQNLAERTRKRLPSEGDDNSAESDLEGSATANQRAVCGLSVEPPIQSTEDNKGYNTHIKDVPVSLIHNMCMLLDEERDIDGKDYKLLASELGLAPAKIRYLKELKQRPGGSPSYVLLMQVFSAGENLGTLHHLHSILKKMERFDVIKVLDDWVLHNS